MFKSQLQLQAEREELSHTITKLIREVTHPESEAREQTPSYLEGDELT